eukprot:g8227.t1
MRDISLRGLEFQFDSDSAVAKADDFVAWLRTSGASPRYSAPGDNYQNGAAERLVRTLKERAKALMKERGAPMTAHAWAMRHAVLLYNNTPTRSLRDNDAEYPFDLRTPAEAHGIETIDIARLPVLFSGADVYVQQMQRATGARAKDTDDVQRERWWADNTQSMIFVGVSPMHADNVFQFVPTFSSTTTSLRTSRTYRVDNRRYKTADWIANAKLAPDGIKAMRHSRAAIRPTATSDSDADETDVDASDLDSDSLSDDECDDWLDECAASAEEDDDMPGLYWVKLPRRMHVSDMADLFDCDESDLMHFMRCFEPFSGTSSRAIETTERPIYDAHMRQDGCVIRCSSSQYGLRVSPRLFHEHATKLFKALGFRVCPSDHCMFHRPADGVLIGIHVDDCVITAPTRSAIRAFKDELRARDVAFTDDQDLSDILGIEIEHGADGSISISQRTYIDNMVKAFDFDFLPAAPTPWIKRRKPPDKLPIAGPTLQLLGKLTWLAMQTRPDIAWPVNKCAQMSADPTRANEMWERMVRIVAYVKQTRDRRLTYTAGDNRGWPTLAVFADADFAGCLETRRSTTGVVTAYNCV